MKITQQNKKIIFSAFLLIIVILISRFLKRVFYAKELKFVQYQTGEELICWDGGCGWTSMPLPKYVSDYANNKGSVPAVVSTNPDSEVKHQEIIGHYYIEKEETYSPLKGVVIGKKYIFYTLKQNDNYPVFIYSRVKQDAEKFFVQPQKKQVIYPIELQPEKEEYLLLAVYEGEKVGYAVANLTAKTLTEPMMFTDFAWEGDYYLATPVAANQEKPQPVRCSLDQSLSECIDE